MEATERIDNPPETIVVLEDCQGNRDKWLELRKGSIGSSDIAAIAGLHPYKSELRCWAEFSGLIQPEDVSDKDDVILGQLMEPVVAAMFSRVNGISVEKHDCMIRRSDLPWAHATPDYLYYLEDAQSFEDERYLECKTTGWWNEDDWTDQLPDAAHVQTLWEIGIGLKKAATCAALIGGKKYRDQDVEFDGPIFAALVSAGESFLLRVRDGNPPQATADDEKLLRLIDPPKSGIVVLEDRSFIDAYLFHDGERKMYAKAEKEAKEKRDAARAVVYQLMGGHSVASVDGMLIERVERGRKEFVSKASTWTELKIKLEGSDGSESSEE